MQAEMFGEGRRRRNDGMKVVINHEHETWKSLYRSAVNSYIERMPVDSEFSAETVRSVALRYTGEPHHYNVWGAMFNSVMRKWLQRGTVVMVGHWNATSPQAHARSLRIYRKVGA